MWTEYKKVSDSLHIDILHSDPSFVVIHKPGNLLAVPGRGPEHQNCVTNQVKKLFPECIEHPAVHRLDMATSGLMVVALTKECQRHLSIQFQQRQVHKTYIALLDGIIAEDTGEINLAFRLDPDNRPYQIHDEEQGKMGTSHFKVLERTGQTTRIEFTPITGRTHQLRVHSAHPKGLGHAIIGDALYGTGQDGDTMFLHATTLSFLHPQTDIPLTFHSTPAF